MDPVQHLYNEITKDEIEKVRQFKKPVRRFRASEAADCARKVWYRLSGYMPTPRAASLELVAQSGNLHHDYVRQLLNLYGVQLVGLQMNEDGTVTEDANVVKEFERNGVRFTVSGRSDGGIVLDSGEAVLEIKSVGNWSYQAINKAYTAGNEALKQYLLEKRKSYLWQGQVMALLQDKTEGILYLLVVNRDNMAIGFGQSGTDEHTGFATPIDNALQEQILLKFARIQKALNAKTPPAPDFNPGSTECGYCEFAVYCHEMRSRKERGIKPFINYPIPELFTEIEEND